MAQAADKVKILGGSATKAKLRRIAYEIYEANFREQQLVLVGIDLRGGFLARQLQRLLSEISPLKVDLLSAKKTGEGIALESTAGIADATIVVVDDVLYSGRTMFLTIAEVMRHAPAKVQTAVLIDRGHRSVPVTHDFVGMVLATSLKQYVDVEVDAVKEKAAAYLF